ncbi:transcriptional coactivator/pterin dehydratase [Lentithecium fluviatile CBS 122367]|uniref:4a-hydroxytetrahydrobiopterin dehydratase n=1 Tax=Lentithecium fluviatile CBS 122367 TaxID=1168545 RepID=A0A6G1JAG1_9PLEO|nr:transcriptional coactivator/pterin dehydratase [Lentithecium fluviatile CBS 122367]
MRAPVFRVKPSNLVRSVLASQLGPRRPPFATITRSGHLGNIGHFSTLTSQAMSSSSPRPNSAGGEVPEIIFSANQPAELPERLSKLTAWTLSTSRMGITRQFTFPTFAAAWRFMSLVADECEARRHHPAWSNMYNEVTIEWTTHRPKGLSIKDVEMAEFCDRTAEEVGLKVQN